MQQHCTHVICQKHVRLLLISDSEPWVCLTVSCTFYDMLAHVDWEQCCQNVSTLSRQRHALHAGIQQPIHAHLWWNTSCAEPNSRLASSLALVYHISNGICWLCFHLYWFIHRQTFRYHSAAEQQKAQQAMCIHIRTNFC